MSIRPLPDTPNRNDAPDVFANKADVFLSALPTFGDEINDLIPMINTAGLAYPAFSSLANFKGQWSDLSGGYDVPTSVYHEGNFWTLIQSLSDITTQEPSLESEYWVLVKILAGPTETRTSSTDITIDMTNSFVQNINMTTTDNSVILGDATKINTGFSFFIYNSGDYDFLIKDQSGYVVGYSQPNKISMIISLSNATADGDWSVTNIDRENKYLNLFVGFDELFNSGNTSYLTVTALSETKAIVCYQDGGNSYYGTSCILDISGSTITAGAEVVFNSGTTSNLTLTALSETKAIVCYRDNDNSNYGTACILDVSGSTITAGAEVVFNSGNTNDITVTALSETKAIVCYQDGSNSYSGTACILDVSGSTITAGAEVVFNSGTTSNLTLTALSETKAIVCYRDGGNSDYGTACVLDISVSTITAGAEVVFNSGNTNDITVTALSETKAIVCYRDYSNSYYGTSCILDISVSTITAGSEVVFNSGNTNDITVTALSETKAIVCYQDYSNSNYGTACILDISGSTITAGAEVVFNSGTTSNLTLTALSETKAIVCYQDGSNSNYGTANILIPIK